MVTNDATILRLKHDVLYEVAKAAWEGNLEEKRDEIPYDMIPGPQASYRCCIYKEREIIKQRVRLAEGKCPTGRDSSNVVQVINAACEECPIASYIVTDNCRKCMGKAINSAYQNPGLPFDLGIRQNLVEQLRHLIEDMGKKVVITYY